jgi:hypothetical protein
MTKHDLLSFTKTFIIEHPDKKEEIKDLYYLALSEIEDGGSETHECELAYGSMIDLINDQNTEN